MLNRGGARVLIKKEREVMSRIEDDDLSLHPGMSPDTNSIIHDNQSKSQASGKRESERPWQIATEVVNAVHNAECEEGIPPEANIVLKSHFLSTKKFNKTFIDCAAAHANKPETNVGFAANVATKGLIFTLATVAAVILINSLVSWTLWKYGIMFAYLLHLELGF